MASSHPRSVNQSRRMNPFPDLDRMRVAFSPAGYGNPDFPDAPISSHYQNSVSLHNMNSQTVPPPLPPRPEMSRSSRMSSYGSSYYSPYSRFSPSMYSPYGGGYGRTPYSRFGMPPDSYNSFIQLAEESTRPAFESIESVVDIVGSISMMLESTYHAVYSSYNAILGVVDQFSRLKDHLAEVLSFLALLRGLRYLCLKILYFLRLKKDNPSVEAAWNTAKSVSGSSEFSQFQSDRKSPWPIFMFVGLVVGAPWLMFKLLSRSVAKKPFDLRSWQDKNGYVMCVGNYDFKTNRRGELSFKAGEQLYVAPKHIQETVPRGWILACNRNQQVGLIPQNYIKAQMLSIQKRKNPVNPKPQVEQVEINIDKSTAVPKIDPVNPFVPEVVPSTSDAVLAPPVSPNTEEQTSENE